MHIDKIERVPIGRWVHPNLQATANGTGWKKIEEKEVDPSGCLGHVHINNSECWDKGSLVKVK